jgi:signal transduction histidine kinase
MVGRVVRRVAGGVSATDAAIATLFLVLELWQSVALGTPALVGEVAERFRAVGAPEVALLVAIHVPLLWRQRAPLTVLVLSSVAFFFASYGLDLGLAGWGMLAALFEFAARADRRSSLLALALLVIGFLVAVAVQPGEDRSPYGTFAGSLYLTLVAVTPWAMGYWTRWRRARARGEELRHAADAEQAVAHERARVARELHDILAHSLSVMVVQAAGAREVLPVAPDRAAEALAQIEVTGRQGLVEVRRLLGLLRGSGDGEPGRTPQPGLDDIGDLVGQVRDAGLVVHVALAGERRPLDPSVDLSAYRIVQEALTNVLKHAGPATVGVLLDYRELGALRLEIVDDGRGAAGRDDQETQRPEGGNGLLGMRERALLVGGRLEAGPRPEGGYRVVATLPFAATSPVPVA